MESFHSNSGTCVAEQQPGIGLAHPRIPTLALQPDFLQGTSVARTLLLFR